MRIALVTDSTASITAEEADALGITIVPLQVIFGDESYRDGIDITAAEFYPKMAGSSVLPSTSQPAVGSFAEVFTRLLPTVDEIVCLLLSSRLSGTVRAAETAREMTGGAITIIDSEMTEYALGVQVLHVARLVQHGATVPEIVQCAAAIRERTSAFIVIDSLENLRRGGRIGAAGALVGTMLQIKPIITLREGVVDVCGKVRTYRRAVETMIQWYERDCGGHRDVDVAVIHSNAPDEAAQVAARVSAITPTAAMRVISIGPVVGVHTGSGSVGLIYYAGT